VDQAKPIAIDVKSGSCPHCFCDRSYEKGSFYALLFIKTPAPRTNFGRRAEGGPSQKYSIRSLHPHGFPAVSAAFGDGRLKYHRLVAFQGTLFAFTQSQCFHATHCAAGWRHCISNHLSKECASADKLKDLE
jgi:hypothetical protein